VRLLVLADTHVPVRARDLPAEVWAEVREADVVVHAGDWVDVGLLDRLQAAAPRLLGVYGNNDGPPVRTRLPEVAHAALEGVRVTVVHETGATKGREIRADRTFPATDLLIFGHSHIPWDSTTPGGMRLLNPGSPTDRRGQPHRTYLTAVLGEGIVQSVQLHKLA
jgi:putative phosphoesterase